MDKLIDALGFRGRTSGAIWLTALVGGGSLAMLLATHLLALIPGLWVGLVQIGLWAVWFVWLGWWLPRQRARRLAVDPRGAYRAAFYRDLLPGVWLGFAQLGRPLLAAILGWQGRFYILLGAPVILIGAALVFEGHRASDVASTMFLNEYQYEYRQTPGTINRRGIYRFISHPMFLGAVLVSLGIGLAVIGNALWLGLINLLTLPVYGLLEDRRLLGIFGREYSTYRATVRGFLPRLK